MDINSNDENEKNKEPSRQNGCEDNSSDLNEILDEFYKSLNVNFNFHIQFSDIYDYSILKKQIDVMQTIRFGQKINVLLLTDRLYGYAKGLQEYMQNSDDISVDVINCYKNATQIITQKHIDFLIIVGHLLNEDNYEIMRCIAKFNKYVSVIIYALDSPLINYICHENHIQYRFDRTEPLDRFIEYMRQCYKIETAKFQKDYPMNTTKEQLWFAAVENEKIQEQLREQAEIDKKKKERRNKILKNIGMAAILVLMFSAVILDYFYRNGDIITQKPKSPPNLVTASWMVTEDCGKYISISMQNFNNSEPPVVYLDFQNEYHFMTCEIYKERNKGKCNTPYWLDEVMYDYIFCQECLSGELIDNYKKAYNLMEINKTNGK